MEIRKCAVCINASGPVRHDGMSIDVRSGGKYQDEKLGAGNRYHTPGKKALTCTVCGDRKAA